MPASPTLCLPRFILSALLGCFSVFASSQSPPFFVEVSESQLTFHFSGLAPTPSTTIGRIVESPAHSGLDGSGLLPDSNTREIWSGSLEKAVIVPRFDQGKDRLFSRFSVTSSDTPPHPPQYVTRVRLPVPVRVDRHVSKKGITCGIDSSASPVSSFPRINQNIDIATLLADAPPHSPYQALANGVSIPLNERAVRDLDVAFQRAKKAGQEVTGILLACQRKASPLPPNIVHPLARSETVPIGPAAFDTATPEGLLKYRAVVGWLSERYGDPRTETGALEGLVIGNEVQSHWSWYHMGEASKHLVLNEYAIAVRVADLAMRSRVNGLNLYVSLDHHWCQSAESNSLRGFSGKEALEILNRRFTAEGNFGWHIAFHPYPENLFNPAFWDDKTATPDFESPKITFKNIEVLAAFLRQSEFQFAGQTRRIALTEQGFHCPNTENGPRLQAAAYALAWKKVQAIPEITSFLYHRHVDHPHENGLRCGVFAHDGSQNLLGVGSRRPIADVVEAAGTDAEEETFAPYLAVLGRSDWEKLVNPVLTPSKSESNNTGVTLVRLIDRIADAKSENLSDVAEKRLPGRLALSPAIQTHPLPGTQGKLTFRLSIPDASPEDFRTVFRTTVFVNHPKSTGGTFSLLVNGLALKSRFLEPEVSEVMEIDLTQWAGQTVDLSLSVHPGKDTAYDWMTWGAASLFLKPSHAIDKPMHPRISRP